ncbi:MAG: TldD/PmbA family protein [Methanocellales archaeon]
MIERIGRNAIKLGLKKDAEEIEIFYSSGRVITVETLKDEIESARESYIQGLGIRAVYKGAVGFSSTNDLSKIEETVESAVKCAKARKMDPNWKGFPPQAKYPIVQGTFDSKIAQLQLDSCVDYILQMIESAKIEKAMPTSARLMCGSSAQFILNSNGLEIEEKSTIIQASIEAIARDQTTSTGFEFDISRNLNLDFQAIGKNASMLALNSLNGMNVETGNLTVLLKPVAFADLLANVFLPAVFADNVQRGRSLLRDKIDLTIASENFTLIDDGLLEGGIGTAMSDDEGTPSQRTTIVERGILKGFLYDSYTAGRAGVKSTGNGVRGSYASVPSVGIRNIIVQIPGSEVIAETERGIIVNSIIGGHTSNPVSGDFSVEARNAFMVEKGEIAKPVKSAMISGNIFEALKQISGAGKDARKVGNIITPTVKIEELRVIG